MRQTAKERLYDKAKKMIDLIYDEVCEKGDKTLDSAFIGKKNGLKYELTVGVKITDPNEPVVVPDAETNGGEETPSENVPTEDTQNSESTQDSAGEETHD